MSISRLVALAALAAVPLAAHAAEPLACHDYLRGVQLGDPDVIAQARGIASPLIDAENALLTYRTPRDASEDTIAAGRMLPAGVLLQLKVDCLALPDDTVDAIVATRMKAAQRDLDKARRDEAAKLKEESLQRQEQKKRNMDDDDRKMALALATAKATEAAPPLPAHIVTTYAVVSKITCGQYLKYGSHQLDSKVDRAFTIVLQHVVDADPVAKTAHITYDGGRQYAGALSYCYDHPTGTLAGALQDYLASARTWAPAAMEKAERQRLAELRAKPDKTAEEKQELAANDVADRAGPRGSCRWLVAYNDYVGGGVATFSDSEAGKRAAASTAWCREHLDATSGPPTPP